MTTDEENPPPRPLWLAILTAAAAVFLALPRIAVAAILLLPTLAIVIALSGF